MHQPLVLIGEMQNEVLECILGLALYSQHVAKMSDVMPPEDSIFNCLNPVKDGLHGDDRHNFAA